MMLSIIKEDNRSSLDDLCEGHKTSDLEPLISKYHEQSNHRSEREVTRRLENV
jgi:hypothetical protein